MRSLRSKKTNDISLEPKIRSLRSAKRNCLNLGLSPLATCDNCKKFQQWLSGLSGRKPSKGDQPHCEEIWNQDPATHLGRLLIQERAKRKCGLLVWMLEKVEHKRRNLPIVTRIWYPIKHLTESATALKLVSCHKSVICSLNNQYGLI